MNTVTDTTEIINGADFDFDYRVYKDRVAIEELQEDGSTIVKSHIGDLLFHGEEYIKYYKILEGSPDKNLRVENKTDYHDIVTGIIKKIGISGPNHCYFMYYGGIYWYEIEFIERDFGALFQMLQHNTNPVQDSEDSNITHYYFDL